jgi:methylmalonyl-CoA mutase
MSKLFKEFDAVSAKQWKQKIQVDLNGADYNQSLIWQSPEGIDVKPFYHRDEFESGFQPVPGQPTDWSVIQQVFIDDAGIAGRLALDALERGAEGLLFAAERKFDVTTVFRDLELTNVRLYFNFSFLDLEFLNELYTYFSARAVQPYLNVDLIGNLARTGNWFHDLKTDHLILDAIIDQDPGATVIAVNADLYQNAGANMIQQLAYALAHANEYLDHYQNKQELKIQFKIAVGTNYFFEIAKLRALRKLYAALACEYGFTQNCHILVTPSKRNKTLFDYNVNMLRTTTECMSAIAGGADSVCNLPYDAIYHKSNEFGERISRNQLLILKAESYFNAVSNPADGAYYIESLTDQLAAKALELFKELEKGGGFLKLLKEGLIQKKIKESAQKEQERFNSGLLVLLGSNKHPNKNDKMKEALELYPFVKTKARKTLLEPIIERRLTEKYEQERLENEA